MSNQEVLPSVSFLGIRVVRYRIIRDSYLGYECQKWRLWFPFWQMMGFTNTHRTIEEAVRYIKVRAQHTVVMSS